jgi:hypothetical protein
VILASYSLLAHIGHWWPKPILDTRYSTLDARRLFVNIKLTLEYRVSSMSVDPVRFTTSTGLPPPAASYPATTPLAQGKKYLCRCRRFSAWPRSWTCRCFARTPRQVPDVDEPVLPLLLGLRLLLTSTPSSSAGRGAEPTADPQQAGRFAHSRHPRKVPDRTADWVSGCPIGVRVSRV